MIAEIEDFRKKKTKWLAPNKQMVGLTGVAK